MDALERRSTGRVIACENVVVIHDKGREVLAQLVDLSQTGALISLFGLVVEENLSDSFELSMHDQSSILQIRVRIVRRSPQWIAIEFTDQRPEVQERLGEKVRTTHLREREMGTPSGFTFPDS